MMEYHRKNSQREVFVQPINPLELSQRRASFLNKTKKRYQDDSKDDNVTDSMKEFYSSSSL